MQLRCRQATCASNSKLPATFLSSRHFLIFEVLGSSLHAFFSRPLVGTSNCKLRKSTIVFLCSAVSQSEVLQFTFSLSISTQHSSPVNTVLHAASAVKIKCRRLNILRTSSFVVTSVTAVFFAKKTVLMRIK